MIKRAVTHYLIQWSALLLIWYFIPLQLCSPPTPPTPPAVARVFIAWSTHVKLKSSLCTWYLIIACCTTVHNGKMSKQAICTERQSMRLYTTAHMHQWNMHERMKPHHFLLNINSLRSHFGFLFFSVISPIRPFVISACKDWEGLHHPHRPTPRKLCKLLKLQI